MENSEKYFKCTECNETFLKSNFQRHYRNAHDFEKAAKCNQCDEVFKTPKDLSTHLVAEHQLELFKCDYCGKSFSLKKYLNQHLASCKKKVVKSNTSSVADESKKRSSRSSRKSSVSEGAESLSRSASSSSVQCENNEKSNDSNSLVTEENKKRSSRSRRKSFVSEGVESLSRSASGSSVQRENKRKSNDSNNSVADGRKKGSARSRRKSSVNGKDSNSMTQDIPEDSNGGMENDSNVEEFNNEENAEESEFESEALQDDSMTGNAEEAEMEEYTRDMVTDKNIVTYDENSQSQEAFFAEHGTDESMLPTMEPLPEEETFGKEMALSVASEMEEKRRLTKKRKNEPLGEGDDDNDSDEVLINESKKSKKSGEERSYSPISTDFSGNDASFPCNFCEKSFESLNILQNHLKIEHELNAADKLRSEGDILCHLANKIYEHANTIETYEKKIKELEMQVKVLTEDKSIMSTEVENVQAQIKGQVNLESNSSADSQIKDLKRQLEKGQEDIYKIEKERVELLVKVDELEKALEESTTREKVFSEEIKTLKKENTCHLCYKKRNLNCEICNQKYANLETLLHHHDLCHNIEKLKKGNICEICGKRFKNQQELVEHLNYGKGSHSCEHCLSFFVHICSLKKHFKTCAKLFQNLAPSYRSYVCHLCSEAFRSESELETHMSKHDGFECDICSMTFESEELLKLHHENVTCEFCDKCFKSEKGLKDHKKNEHNV